MPDAPKDDEVEKRRDELLRRMLKTPPTPHRETKGGKVSLTGADQKKKPDGPSAKKDRPEAQ